METRIMLSPMILINCLCIVFQYNCIEVQDALKESIQIVKYNYLDGFWSIRLKDVLEFCLRCLKLTNIVFQKARFRFRLNKTEVESVQLGYTYIADMDKCPQDKCCPDKCRGNSCNLFHIYSVGLETPG